MNRMKRGTLADLADLTGELEASIDSPFQTSDSDQNQSLGFEFPASPCVPGEGNLGKNLPSYSTFLPVHYQSGHAYPLVVWLHSEGANRDQLNSVMPEFSDRNYVGVAFDGPDQRSPATHSSQKNWLQSSNTIEAAANQVALVLEHVGSRFNINPDRIFVAGQGAGGTMAFRIAFERPELFAGVLSINGSLPSTLNPLSNWRDCRDVPVFWAHGRGSKHFPESNLCHQLRLLHVAGFDVTLRQYPCKNQLPKQVFGDATHWMMEQLSKSGANIIG